MMGLKGQTIFVLALAKFDGPYESTSFTIAKYLAKANTVYYVENPFTWKDYFKLKSSSEVKLRRKYFSKVSDGIIDTQIPGLKVVISPLLLSINFIPEGSLYRRLLKYNESVIIARVNKIIRSQKIQNHIYINSFNFHYPGVGDQIKPKLQVYHCVDPLILPFDRAHGLLSEAMLVKKSDLVICTSRQLYREKKVQNNNTFFIPNAADLSHSIKALEAALPVHESLKNIKRPILGYFGNIERRLDFDLIRELTALNPDKSFVFAGPTSSEFIPAWFYDSDNIFLTGRLPYDQMPSLIKGFDVAMIPFKKDDVSSTIFPLKLFEYLGAGKPVVSTDFNPDLKEFTGNTVWFCDDAFAFSKAINEALETESPEKVRDRVEIARENTWEKRGSQFSELIESRLETGH